MIPYNERLSKSCHGVSSLQTKAIPIMQQNQRTKSTSNSFCAALKCRPPHVLSSNLKKIREEKKTVDSVFDNFVSNLSKNITFNDSLGNAFDNLLDTCDSTCWVVNQIRRVLILETTGKEVDINKSIVSLSYRTNRVECIQNPTMHECYEPSIDSACCSIYVPLTNNNDEVLMVVKVIASNGKSTFSDEDQMICKSFASKFKLYSKYILPFVQNKRSKLYRFLEEIKFKFQARETNYYSFDKSTKKITKYSQNIDKLQDIKIVGFVYQVLVEGISLCFADVTDSSCFKETDDGSIQETVIAIPIVFNSHVDSIVLRGRSHNGIYNKNDIDELKNVIPLLEKVLKEKSLSEKLDITVQTDLVECRRQINVKYIENNLTDDLLKVLQFGENVTLTNDAMSLLITMAENAKLLLKCEQCHVFLNHNDEIIKDNGERFKLSEGIAGKCILDNDIIVSDDISLCKQYEPTIDGESVTNIIAVPIKCPSGYCIGCFELYNMNNVSFTEADINLVKAFAVICGNTMKNSRNFMAAIDVGKNLNMLYSGAEKTKGVDSTLKDLKYFFNASRITIFSYDHESNSLIHFTNIGKKIEFVSIFVRDSVETKKPVLFNEKDIQNFQQDFGKTLASIRSNVCIERRNNICSIFRNSHNDSTINDVNVKNKPENIIAIPLLDSESSVIGAIEMVTCTQLQPDDICLLEFTAKYISQILSSGKSCSQNEIYKIKCSLIEKEENDQCRPPSILLPETKPSQKNIKSLNFDSMQWNSYIGFKVVFYMFSVFNLQQLFGIRNKTLFNFLNAILKNYNKVANFNWRHAIDTFQFVFLEIINSGYKQNFSNDEILAVGIAAICHNVGHQEEEINRNSEIPLDILSKHQCYGESSFCKSTICLLSNEDQNILEGTLNQQKAQIWSLVIELILSLNMNRHNALLVEAKEKLAGKEYNEMNNDERLLSLKILLKCADSAPIARDFKIADRDKSVATEEFFRSGDISSFDGLVFSGKIHDRLHIDKEKSRNSVIEKIILPCFELVSQIFPPLLNNYEAAKCNLAQWNA